MLSDAAYRVTYDPYNHKVWVGTFKGVCAYDLKTGKWEQPSGLSSAGPAPVSQIYVDPTTGGQSLYVTFSAGATGCTPAISDYRCVIEYNVSTGAIKRYKFHGDDMYNACVAKTAPNTIWAVYWRQSTAQALVSKYRTDTAQLVSTVNLGSISGTSYKPTATGSKFAYQIANARVDGVDQLYVTIRDEATPFNGVLRIRDTGDQPSVTVWGHAVTAYGTDKRPARLIVPPQAPGTVYCIMTGVYDTDAASRIYRFGDGEPAGTLLTQPNSSSALTGAINSGAFGPDGTTLYYAQSFTGVSHEPVVDFFPSGAIGGLGGFNHNTYFYGGFSYGFLTIYYTGDVIDPATSQEHARDADLYANGSAMTSEVPFSTSLHLMNGFYLAEARMGTLPGYPAGAGLGHTGHMFIFDPKACPYAPRVDEGGTVCEIADGRTLRARVFSPGFPQAWANPKSREGGFIAATVNPNTVGLTDAGGAAVPIESVRYNEFEDKVTGNLVCEVVARAATDLAPGATYHLTLACGVNGIKNTKGASLVNTRPGEFVDEITLAYTVPPQEGAPPLIIRQPGGQTVGEGQDAIFSVAAVSAVPLSYQWQIDGVSITGATSATYVRSPATAGDDGKRFTVKVSNQCGTVTSAPADLTVLAIPPAITDQPAAQIVSLGEAATFGVSAVGTAPLTYQWFRNSVAVAGATSATYTTPPAVAGDHGAVFSVTVNNALGAATSSAAARLGVILAPRIVAQPYDRSVSVGSTVIFSVVTTMVNPDEQLAYQWRRNGQDIPGANSQSYLLPAASLEDNDALFSVVVSNAAGAVTSADARLTVYIPLSIVQQPVSQTVSEGDRATFTVAATGTEPLRYQWHRNYTSIDGATDPSYTTPPVTAADSGAVFGVNVGNDYYWVSSATATLTVGRRPTAVSLDCAAVDENQPAGTTVGTLTATDPDSTGPFTYALVPGDGSDGNEFFDLAGDQVQTRISFDRETQSSYTIRVRAIDPDGLWLEQSFRVQINNVAEARVLGRHIFYNVSRWDSRDAAANALDDKAVATDKQALLPGQKAAFANYTSYSRGINGIMVDIAALGATPTADDFAVRVGNNNDPTTWTTGPAPSVIAVRKGAGVDGSDRVTLIWPDWPNEGSIAKQWLQITVQATVNTDLPNPDVFYFGNAVGETGDSAASALVNVIDYDRIRSNYNTPLNYASVTSPYDLDRDRLVNVIDVDIVRANCTTPLTALRLITVPPTGAGLAIASGDQVPGVADPASEVTSGDLPGERALAVGLIRDHSLIVNGGTLQVYHKTTPGMKCRLQAASAVTGPWRDVPGSDREAGADGILRLHMLARDADSQQFFRWIELKPRLETKR